jgi:hypothetical protein
VLGPNWRGHLIGHRLGRLLRGQRNSQFRWKHEPNYCRVRRRSRRGPGRCGWLGWVQCWRWRKRWRHCQRRWDHEHWRYDERRWLQVDWWNHRHRWSYSYWRHGQRRWVESKRRYHQRRRVRVDWRHHQHRWIYSHGRDDQHQWQVNRRHHRHGRNNKYRRQRR